MELKKIWLSAGSGPKNRYALRLLGSVAGIAVLAVVLVGGGTVLCYRLGWPQELFGWRSAWALRRWPWGWPWRPGGAPRGMRRCSS